MQDKATHAAIRFGQGLAPGELEVIGAAPEAWLLNQLKPGNLLPAAYDDLDSGAERTAALLAKVAKGTGAIEKHIRKVAAQQYRDDIERHLTAAIVSKVPFVERLTHFWANHFTVSAERPQILGLAVPFEAEAIRPNLLGRFADLLIASTSHQAMLLYLDNARSFGPNSKAGKWKDFGLNENLAREILELHTLGVEGGYTQEDVRALAMILTGWTLQRPRDDEPGAFQFAEGGHEPGDKVLLGRRFRENGMQEGIDALEMLATHPATARHVALKLARHFVADQPPQATVDRLTRVFLDSGGDLPALYRALVVDKGAWSQPLAKLKTPQELIVSTLRAIAWTRELEGAVASLKILGQLPYYAPSPQGYSDLGQDWAGPDQVLKRVDWAALAGEKIAEGVDPNVYLATALGGFADHDLSFMVKNAPSRREALALVLVHPAFQRR
jgi:uncharacterized protein (DUF1800 family)